MPFRAIFYKGDWALVLQGKKMNDEAVAFSIAQSLEQSIIAEFSTSKVICGFFVAIRQTVPAKGKHLSKAVNDFSWQRWAKNLGKGAPLLVPWVIRTGH